VKAAVQAREADNGKVIRVGGGVDVIQQTLCQRLIDERHNAISPILLGAGESLFEGINQQLLVDLTPRFAVSTRATKQVADAAQG
jgi:dihydrofolate reductase